MSHTPGPWSVGKEVDSESRLVYIPIKSGVTSISATGVYGRRSDGSQAGAPYKDKFGIARTKPSISEDEARANARLIAAAPELLQALKNLLILEEDVFSDEVRVPAILEARAAIAKATGEAL